MNLHVRPLRIVHHVCDVIVIKLCLPRRQPAIALGHNPFVGQRPNYSFRLLDIHVEGWITHVRRLVIYERALQRVPLSQYEAHIGKSVDLLKLRKLTLLPPPAL